MDGRWGERDTEPNGAGRSRVSRLADEPFSVFEDEATIGEDASLGAEVEDEVPVEGGCVDPAGLGVGLSEREVDGAADFLVVEDASGESVDAGVESDAELADSTGSGVEFEHGAEVGFVGFGAGADDLSVLEFEFDADELASVASDGVGALEASVDGVFEGSGEDFAGGHVAAAVGVDPGSIADGHGDVDVGSLDADFADVAHAVDEGLLTGAEGAPLLGGIGGVEEHGAGDEGVVLVAGHAGVGGVGVGGVLGEDPTVAAHEVAESAEGSVADGLPGGVDGGGGGGVGLGGDADARVEGFGLVAGEHGKLVEPVFGGVVEEVFGESGERDSEEGVAAAVDDGAITGLDEGSGLDFGENADGLAGFDVEAVSGEESGPLFDGAFVERHGSGLPPIRILKNSVSDMIPRAVRRGKGWGRGRGLVFGQGSSIVGSHSRLAERVIPTARGGME